jgi:hypothetical protein
MLLWKNLALCAGLGTAVVGAGAGVAQRGPGFGARARLMRLARELQITPDQGKQLRAAGGHLLVERRALDMEELTPAERKSRLFELRREFFATAQRTLTTDQRAKLKAKWEAGRAQRLEQLRSKVAQAADRLQLSPEQRALAKQVFIDAKAQAEQLKADRKLDDATRLAKLVGLLEDSRDRLYRLLTPDQKQKAKRMLEEKLQQRGPALDIAGDRI